MAELSSFRTLIACVDDHARRRTGHVAMRQKRHGIWQETTWAGLSEHAAALAAGLIDLGFDAGNHAGILSENRREWVQAQLAIMAAGGVTVGMYPTSPAAEIRHLVTASDTTLLFIEDQEQLDKIKELEGELPALRQLVIFDPKGMRGDAHLGLISFDDLLARGRAALGRHDAAITARKGAIRPQDTAMMVFTSGSTGLPKAAQISHANLSAALDIAAQMFADFGPDTNVLSYLPLCHIAEQNITVVNCIAGGRVMNFGESLRTVTPDLRDIAPQIFFGVPRIWEKMQSAVTVQAQTSGPVRRALTLRALAGARVRGQVPRARWTGAQRGSHAFWDALVYRHIRAYLGLSRCRFAISAAAPIAPELLAFMRGIGVDIREAWGMSETTGAATLQAAQGACLGRVGGPVAGVELRIAPDGELLLRGGIVFAGYYRNPQATGDALRDGWLHTGDVAHMFEDGTISITDRKKDIMINAAGKNLSPALIETTLKASPYIKEVVVIADQRPFVTALVQIDYDTTRLWAEGQGISYTTFRSLAENPRVVTLIEAEVARLNADLARVEQVKKLALLPKELDHDDGEVTATMKVRRAAIMATYAPLIAALYQS